MESVNKKEILEEILKYLKNVIDVNKGVVGACLLAQKKDGLISKFFGYANRLENNLIEHAERNALKNFEKTENYHEYTEFLMVTTLSPCKLESDRRSGDSCTDMLLSRNITNVYSGLLDPLQPDITSEINLEICDDEKLSGLCKGLFGYFDNCYLGEDGKIHKNRDVPMPTPFDHVQLVLKEIGQRTRQEIEDLKYNWNCDAIWDIEDTEGFEEHKVELLLHRLTMEKKWDESYDKELKKYSLKIGTDNQKLANYIRGMEKTITDLEDKVYKLSDRICRLENGMN